MHITKRFLRAAAFLILVVAFLPQAAWAERFHVRIGGEMTSGPSLPDDWSLANCYASLEAALGACAPADSVLLFAESHALDSAAILPALVTNQTLAEETGATEIVLGVLGSLTANGTAATCELRGLVVRGGEPNRTVAAVTVVPGGSLTGVRLATCNFVDVLRSAVPGTGGAAFSAPSAASGLVLDFDHCTFTGNQSPGRGGAVHVGPGYAVTMTGCTFAANGTIDGGLGGALGVNATANPTSVLAEDCVFTDNFAAGPGGAIDAAGASVTLRRCEVRGSRSAAQVGATFAEGAGVRVQHQSGHTEPITVLAENCTFADNRGNLENDTTGGDGGGLFVRGGLGRTVDLHVTECVFQGNVNAQGGGLYVGRYATGLVEYSQFIDNIAWYQGGGAMKGGVEENLGELVTFVYCLFRGNLAGFAADGSETGEYSRGGAVLVRNFVRAELFNCTFVDNMVNTYAYAVGDAFAHPIESGEWTDENRCSLVNCVFWGSGNDVQAHSEDVGGMATVSHLAAESGQLVLGTDPDVFVLLATYPFASLESLIPLDGSVLIDAGVDLGYTRDLLGLPVPDGASPDIGAYEWHSPVAVGDQPPATSMSLTVFPNPFNPRTTILARLEVSSTVSVAIYDTRGHRVTELIREALPAGTHELRWDGRDAQGRDVSAGTYLARMEAGGQTPAVTKLVLVR
jgi:predicted outer membrane repeat protein